MDKLTNKVRIITENDDDYARLLIKAQLPDLEITHSNSEATLLLGSPPLVAPILNEFSNLEWVQSCYAGVDHLMKPDLRQDYELTNVKGIFGQQIAEYVLAYTISHFRHLDLYRIQQQNKVWKQHNYRTIAGKKIVILGTGAIGNYLASALSGFNVHSIGVNRTGIPPKESAFSQTVHIEQLSSYLSGADVVVSTLPNTPETNQLINSEFLSQCEGILLFNVGRGNTIHTDSLLKALDNGQVSHAYLDVFINEPISEQCPYWHHPNVTVTPHIAAHSFPEQVFEIFRDNYFRWRDGFQLQNRIDFSKGY